MERKADIYCPKCKWKPGPEDRWVCMPQCGTVWNTFWTRGVCPGCAHHWRDTQCIACGEISPHESWYHYREPEEGSEDTASKEKDLVIAG